MSVPELEFSPLLFLSDVGVRTWRRGPRKCASGPFSPLWLCVVLHVVSSPKNHKGGFCFVSFCSHAYLRKIETEEGKTASLRHEDRMVWKACDLDFLFRMTNDKH